MHINLEKKLPKGSVAARGDRSPVSDDLQPTSQSLLTDGFAGVASSLNGGKVFLHPLKRQLIEAMQELTGITSQEIVMMHGLNVPAHDIDRWVHSDGLTVVNPVQLENVIRAYEQEAGCTDSVQAERPAPAHI